MINKNTKNPWMISSYKIKNEEICEEKKKR